MKIDTAKPVNFAELQISFKNVTFVRDESEFYAMEAQTAAEEAEEAEAEENESEAAAEEILALAQMKKCTEKRIVQVDFIPASAISQTALKYKAKSNFRFDGKILDAKIVLMLKSRGLSRGQTVIVTTEGQDAEEAMQGFLELLEHGTGKKFF